MAFLELDGRPEAVPGAPHVAVQDFNLAAEKGEFVSFLGPSGCGKTTTLRMIAGFEQPTAGTITIDGKDITEQPPNHRNVGHGVPVVRAVPEHDRRRQHRLRAAGPEAPEGPDPQARRRAARARSTCGTRASAYPYQLSGGQQQRVALARALAIEPRGPAPRRAAVRPRRQDPRRPAQGDPVDPAPARHHHGLRDPRPGGGAVAVRPGRRHERGPGRADRPAVGDLQLPGDAVRGLVRRARSTSCRRTVVDAATAGSRSPARRSAAPAPIEASVGSARHGRAPAGGGRAGRGGGREPPARASSRTSASSARSSGPRVAARPTARPSSLDQFNEPALAAAGDRRHGRRSPSPRRRPLVLDAARPAPTTVDRAGDRRGLSRLTASGR